MKDPKKVADGKRSKVQGAAFELRVRKDLEEKGWIVDRWSNNVKDNKLVPAKVTWRRTPKGMFPMGLNSGFPDFTAFRYDTKIIGVECKMTGKLDKEEKEKCQWLLDNNIFSKILIASKEKEKNRIKIVYTEWKPQ